MLAVAGRGVEELRLGHTLDVDTFTGGATLRVPLPVPAGRAGVRPDLALIHHGSANSVFGVGWSLAGIPMISIDTRDRLPRFDGLDPVQLDGTELTPWLDGTGAVRERQVPGYRVTYLRPRRTVASARVERWTALDGGRVHYRVRDAGNAITVFGARRDGTSRIADPDDPARVFAWLPELRLDPHGNAIWFDWLAEDLAGVDRARPEEQRRPATAQRYLARIVYGNARPLALGSQLLDGELPADLRWCFHVVLDYGDHDAVARPKAVRDRTWPVRPDVFSSGRPGFDVRTYRLCRRVLVFHDLPALGPQPALVSALALDHDLDPAGSLLTRLTLTGHRVDRGLATQRSLPPLELSYAAPRSEASFVPLPASLADVPGGFANRQHTFVDLYGEGLPGLLTEIDRAWYWKPNRGAGRFGEQVRIAERPAVRPGELAWGDHDRDGDTELARHAGRMAGSWALERDTGTWSGFRPARRVPHVEGLRGDAQWVDLDGDGRADVLVIGTDRLVWFPSTTEESWSNDEIAYGAPVELPRPSGLPPTSEDAARDLFFADMTGDGLADLVRVQNGRVEYWPNRGNGRFGDGVLMDDPPAFSADRDFDASRLRFVDLDGSGTTDLIYLGAGEIRRWINASGNRFVELPALTGLPTIDNRASLRVLELLGDGRPCLTWSTALGEIQYLPLAGTTPSRTLLAVEDGGGSETRLTYRSSALEYLRDAEVRPWSTRLPAHAAVVVTRELIDHVEGSRQRTRYEYHDGHYDGRQRRAHGFGHVDVIDADAWVRTWFHLGTAMWNHERPGDTWTGDPELVELPAHHLDDDLTGATPDELSDALAGLAGALLRREVFAVAGGVRAAHPFEVHQASLRARRGQPRRRGTRSAFELVPHVAMTAVYEQAARDPRITQQLAVEVDERGAVVRRAEVGHRRRPTAGPDLDAQTRDSVVVHDERVLHLDTDERFELGIPAEHRTLELHGVDVPGLGLRPDDLRRPEVVASLAAPLPHLAPWPGAIAARLLRWERSRYWDRAREAAAPFGEVGGPTLLHHDEVAAFAASLVGDLYGDRVDAALLLALGYVERDGYWWRGGDIQLFAETAHFELPIGVRRRDGSASHLDYDPLDLVPVRSTPARGGAIAADIDWHLLAPWRVTDANGAIVEARHDALGVVIATTRRGQVEGRDWGHAPLAEHEAATPTTLGELVSDPERHLQHASEVLHYDLEAWRRERAPIAAIRLTRETLLHDGHGGGVRDGGRIALEVTYLDGLGRVRQVKTRVDAGPAIQRDAGGGVVLDAGGHPVLAPADSRWRASGGIARDDRGRPIRVHQPFFTPSGRFENDEALRHLGVADQTSFDAMGRAVRVDHPDGTFDLVRHAPWSVERADAADTVEDSTYRILRQGLPPDAPERQAYEHARRLAGTTVVTFLDPAGRAVGQLARGGADDDVRTETHLDALGATRAQRDGRGLLACEWVRDLTGHVLHERSVDAGTSWSLPDADDRPARHWDARGHAIERRFDALDRTTAVHVRGGGLDHVVEQRIYGEDLDAAEARARNLHGRVTEIRDQAGVLTVSLADPTGAALGTARRVRVEVDGEPDWRESQPLDDALELAWRRDALGRPVFERLPDGTMRETAFGRDGALASVRLTTPDGGLRDVAVVAATDHDARGARTRMVLGNAVELDYTYDRETFQLRRQRARRGARRYQDLESTYDPTGKLVRLHDRAHEGPGGIIGGGAVEARRDFTYDAHGRLIRATGRVHQALLAHDDLPGTGGTIKGTRHLALDNGQALERYAQEYTYDAAGNLWRQRHLGSTSRWTTTLWISPSSNRAVPSEDRHGAPISDPEARFDAAGNLRQLDHLRALTYSWRNTLARVVVVEREGGAADAEAYTYDAEHQRVRKVWDRAVHGGSIERVEKVYVGDQERKRIYRDGRVVLERWSTHVDDGAARVALIHRWVQDDLRREVPAPTTRTHYQLTTHQGSSALELDEAGEVISYEEYFPHGGSAFIAGRRALGVDLKDYRYCGKERDDASSLYYYGYRYLAPWLGRWLIPDPLGPLDGLNLYQFVLGDPVGNVDPDGLQTATTGRKIEDVVDKYDEYNKIPGNQKQRAVNLFNSRNAARLGWYIGNAEKGDNGWIIDEKSIKQIAEKDLPTFVLIVEDEDAKDIEEAIAVFEFATEAAERWKPLAGEGRGTSSGDGAGDQSSETGGTGGTGSGAGGTDSGTAGARSGTGSSGSGTGGSGSGATGTGTGGPAGSDPSGTGVGSGRGAKGAGRGAGGAGTTSTAGPAGTSAGRGSGTGRGAGSGRGAGITPGPGTGGAGTGTGNGARGGGGTGFEGGVDGGTGQRPRPSGSRSGTATQTGGSDDAPLRDDIPPGFRTGLDPNGTVDGKHFGTAGTGDVDSVGGRTGSHGGHADGRAGGVQGGSTTGTALGDAAHRESLWDSVLHGTGIATMAFTDTPRRGAAGGVPGGFGSTDLGFLGQLGYVLGGIAITFFGGKVASTIARGLQLAGRGVRRLATAARHLKNSAIARLNGGILADTNVLSSVATADPEAITFAERNAGSLYVNERVRDELVAGMGEEAYEKLIRKYGIRELAASEEEARAIMAQIGVTSPARVADFEVLATAQRHGLSLATGDGRLITAALRSGMNSQGQVVARMFEGSASRRLKWYRKVRQSVRQWTPDLDPMTVTGSPTRR